MTLGLLGAFLLFTAIQWWCLISRKSKLSRENDPIADMKVDLDQDDDSDKQQTDINISTETFLRYHTYRLYFMGFNSSSLPWSVPTDDIPISALTEGNIATLESILNDNKEQLRWTSQQTFFLNLLSIIFPPLANYYQAAVKRSKLRILKNLLLSTFD